MQSMGKATRSREACCATIGLSLPATFEALTGESDPKRAARFRHLFVEKADQVMTSGTHLFAGVDDLIRRLNSSGSILGILSTKFRYRIRQILDKYALADKFDIIVGGEDVEKHKPDPEGMRLFLSKASLAPDQAILVGDSLVDAETAHRSGVDFVAVLTGTTAAEEFADFAPRAVLNSVMEIEAYAGRSAV
ncbi:MAG: HAD family hydrolase [Desulfosarcinaceae bacterium]